jgi:hypothetical protein
MTHSIFASANARARRYAPLPALQSFILFVMRGLGPRIHACCGERTKTWMAATSGGHDELLQTQLMGLALHPTTRRRRA